MTINQLIHNMNTYQEQWANTEKFQVKQVTGVGDMEFPDGIEERGSSRDQLY